MIAGGSGNKQTPNKKEKEDLDDFISRLDHFAGLVKEGKKIKKPAIKNSLASYILPAFSRAPAKQDMGDKYVACDLY